jgi:hypothetical protein
MLPASAAGGANAPGIVLAGLAASVASGPEDAAGKAATIAAVTSASLSLVQLTAPGMGRLRRARAALDKAGDVLAAGVQHAVLGALLEAADQAAAVVGGDEAKGAAFAAWVHAQSAQVLACPSFARGLVAEVAFAAAGLDGDGKDMGAALRPSLRGLTVAVAAAAAAVGEGGDASVGAFALSGAQLACAADDMFAPDVAQRVFALLKEPAEPGAGFGAIKGAAFAAYAAATAAVAAAGGPLALVVAEPVGRSAALEAAAKALA